MRELIQKNPFSRTTYRIENDHLSVRKKGLGSHEEFDIKFEYIGFEISKRKTAHKLWGSLFLFGLALACAYGSFTQFKSFSDPTGVILILCTFMFAGMGIYGLYENTEKVYVMGGTYSIHFEAANPSKAAVDEFIANLHSAIRNYHREKLAIVLPYSDKAAQANTFQWLVEIGAISQSEYQNLMEELRTRDLLN